MLLCYCYHQFDSSEALIINGEGGTNRADTQIKPLPFLKWMYQLTCWGLRLWRGCISRKLHKGPGLVLQGPVLLSQMFHHWLQREPLVVLSLKRLLPPSALCDHQIQVVLARLKSRRITDKSVIVLVTKSKPQRSIHIYNMYSCILLRIYSILYTRAL